MIRLSALQTLLFGIVGSFLTALLVGALFVSLRQALILGAMVVVFPALPLFLPLAWVAAEQERGSSEWRYNWAYWLVDWCLTPVGVVAFIYVMVIARRPTFHGIVDILLFLLANWVGLAAVTAKFASEWLKRTVGRRGRSSESVPRGGRGA